MSLPDALHQVLHLAASGAGAAGGDGGEGGDTSLFLGKDFFPWMILAFGAAMVVGNALALVRPPQGSGGEPRPVVRSVVMIVIGLVGAVWGIASLLS